MARKAKSIDVTPSAAADELVAEAVPAALVPYTHPLVFQASDRHGGAIFERVVRDPHPLERDNGRDPGFVKFLFRTEQDAQRYATGLALAPQLLRALFELDAIIERQADPTLAQETLFDVQWHVRKALNAAMECLPIVDCAGVYPLAEPVPFDLGGAA